MEMSRLTSTLMPNGEIAKPPAATGGQVPLAGALVLIDMEVGRSADRWSCIRGGVDKKHCQRELALGIARCRD